MTLFISRNTLFFLFCLFRATPLAYGSSQARGPIWAVAASLHHSHSYTRSEPCLWPTPQLKATAGSLTHWARPGIKPWSSWMLVGFVNHWATMATPLVTLFDLKSLLFDNYLAIPTPSGLTFAWYVLFSTLLLSTCPCLYIEQHIFHLASVSRLSNSDI